MRSSFLGSSCQLLAGKILLFGALNREFIYHNQFYCIRPLLMLLEMLSENDFSDMGPKIRFLCYQKRPFSIKHFLITFSDSPILLENLLVLGLLDDEDAVVSRENICM